MSKHSGLESCDASLVLFACANGRIVVPVVIFGMGCFYGVTVARLTFLAIAISSQVDCLSMCMENMLPGFP